MLAAHPSKTVEQPFEHPAHRQAAAPRAPTTTPGRGGGPDARSAQWLTPLRPQTSPASRALRSRAGVLAGERRDLLERLLLLLQVAPEKLHGVFAPERLSLDN